MPQHRNTLNPLTAVHLRTCKCARVHMCVEYRDWRFYINECMRTDVNLTLVSYTVGSPTKSVTLQTSAVS